MLYYQLSRSSYQESLQILEADVQLANALALKWVSGMNFGLQPQELRVTQLGFQHAYYQISRACSVFGYFLFLCADYSHLCASNCNPKSQGWCISSNEIGLQSIGTPVSVFAPMDGMLLYMSIPKISKPLPHNYIQGCLLFMLMGERTSLHMEGRQPLRNSMVCKNFFKLLFYYSGGYTEMSGFCIHSCACSNKNQHAAVILPSLHRLHGNLAELNNAKKSGCGMENLNGKRVEEGRKLSDVDLDREDECGICMEPCTKMVLPNCCHAMCINCYHDWNMRSESCPFCRGSLKRVNSEDLWVLTCSGDVIDTETVSKEDLLRFYLYINNLPKDIPDALFLVYYEYLI
ncbi:hypothetical protein HHK36_029504 [Tetracentron sinense]|uniref:RING-type domain-containing protein n=1 Tax=Tetracentron sinense TaxID=13715 RepID=A0A834YDT2_TETSI|nr:hypothetical protein HHK36_029504 [Tetracentron sinense]